VRLSVVRDDWQTVATVLFVVECAMQARNQSVTAEVLGDGQALHCSMREQLLS